MFGVPSGFGAMSFSDQITRWWFAFYFLERPRFTVSCVSSVFYCLQLRGLILLSLLNIPGIHNNIADALSRFHWQEFRRLAPWAQPYPVPVPHQPWDLLIPPQ